MATVGINSKQDVMKEVERDWLAIDRGEAVLDPVHRTYFESAEATPNQPDALLIKYCRKNLQKLSA